MTTVPILVVPIQVEALYLERDSTIFPATADFTRLPYRSPDGDVNPGDVNPENPWLSDQIVYQPFEEDWLRLKAGLHLHWVLPDAFRKGTNRGGVSLVPFDEQFVGSLKNGKLPKTVPEKISAAGIVPEPTTAVIAERGVDGNVDRWRITGLKEDRSATVRLTKMAGVEWLRVHVQEISFPPVPNRWLVRRRWKGETRCWVVESDFLHPPGPRSQAQDRQEPVCFPWPLHPQKQDDAQPFRRLGRVLELAEFWKQGRKPENYLSCLTAIGYGELTFAAFYPNCHSVFGFHDPKITTADGVHALDYQVVGWHADEHHDLLRYDVFHDTILEAYRRYGFASKSPTSAEADALQLEALRASYNWTFEGLPTLQDIAQNPELKRDPSRFPIRTFLIGSIAVDLSSPAQRIDSDAECHVAIGHTGTEALSAYVGEALNGSKSEIEDQLEALHLWPKLEGLRIDIGLKFGEARHEKEFFAVDAGRRWTVVPRSDAAAPSAVTELEPDLQKALKVLNQAEAEFDRSAAQLAALRRQLYADWCKYLVCTYPKLGEAEHYPDMDVVREFIETTSLPAAEAARTRRRTARENRENAFNEIKKLLDSTNSGAKLELKPRPAPRFWAPKEPAVLLVGNSLPELARDDALAPLKCILELMSPFERDGSATAEQVLALAEIADRFRSQPRGWNPLFLDWQVGVFPHVDQSNLTSNRRSYAPNFMDSNFEFDQKSADLNPKILPTANEAYRTQYRGRSILTPHVGRHLRAAIEGWLRRRLSLVAADTDVLGAARAKFKEKPDPIAENIANAYAHVYGEAGQPGVRFMAQALTGFNAALRMQRQTMQLPIADPLGFEEDRDFAQRVALAVGGENRTSPLPLNEFHPIRAGLLEIEALRLVDSFGRWRSVKFAGNLIPAESMRPQPGANGGSSNMALLRPRIVQPTRVKFRWLDAAASHKQPVDATDHRAGSALCGWLVHDLAGKEMLVHAADGSALGRISTMRHWHGAPGMPHIAPWQIDNPHLARLVVYLLQAPQLGTFLDQIERQLHTIVPDEFAEHDGVQFLVGRPLAVVRAELTLQLYGPPASNQDWKSFRRDLASETVRLENCDRFDTVQFKVRLGDAGQLNDGLVAFWEEEHSPNGRCSLKDSPVTADIRQDVALSFARTSQFVTMLIDPRAPVHARSGILPTKVISIPRAHYADIVGRMSMALPVGPILCPGNTVALHAPDTTRYAVSWLQHENGEWLEEAIAGTPSTAAEWSAATRIREGWLKLTPKTNR